MRIEPLTVNGYTITLPVGMEETLNTKVRDSYQTFLRESTKDVRRHLTCATALLPPALRKIKQHDTPLNILHPFGGVGATAQIIDQTVAANHVFWERDPNLVEFLSTRYQDVLKVDDSFYLLTVTDLEPYDAIMLDMSVGTIKTKYLKIIWERIGKWINPNRFVWFTDTACHKIHLNYKTYAADFGYPVENTAESYMIAYAYWLQERGMVITEAMREAGEVYAIAKDSGHTRFQTIPYV